MNLREAAQQALEALEKATRFMSDSDYRKLNEAIDVLRAALAAPGEYARVNPLGGPATMFDAIARRLRSGEPYDEVLDDYGLQHTALAEPVQEPVAWRTFDGEGGYDYRTYEDNEDYAAEWAKRNPRHIGWVEPLYTAQLPPQRPVEPVQEPVAVFDEQWGQPVLLSGAPLLTDEQPLYTAPPQRKPLSEEEIEVLALKHAPPVHPDFFENDDWLAFARAVERAHGIKENT